MQSFLSHPWPAAAWSLQPVPLVIGMLACGILTCLVFASMALVLGAKRQMRREARRNRQALDELAMRLQLRSAAACTPPPELRHETEAPAPARPGANLNWRVQALRLLRRGQDVAHVAAVLGVSRKEIELLIRVHQLAAARLPAKSANAAGAGAA